jgi:hypothetical protein
MKSTRRSSKLYAGMVSAAMGLLLAIGCGGGVIDDGQTGDEPTGSEQTRTSTATTKIYDGLRSSVTLTSYFSFTDRRLQNNPPPYSCFDTTCRRDGEQIYLAKRRLADRCRDDYSGWISAYAVQMLICRECVSPARTTYSETGKVYGTCVTSGGVSTR